MKNVSRDDRFKRTGAFNLILTYEFNLYPYNVASTPLLISNIFIFVFEIIKGTQYFQSDLVYLTTFIRIFDR